MDRMVKYLGKKGKRIMNRMESYMQSDPYQLNPSMSNDNPYGNTSPLNTQLLQQLEGNPAGMANALLNQSASTSGAPFNLNNFQVPNFQSPYAQLLNSSGAQASTFYGSQFMPGLNLVGDNPYSAFFSSGSTPFRPKPPPPSRPMDSSPQSTSGQSGDSSSMRRKKLFDDETLRQAVTRIHSTRAVLGDTAVFEARKGLSRIIDPASDEDIELFGIQLTNTDISACELNYETYDDAVLCVAVSYKQHCRNLGRFKFSDHQWENLKHALEELAFCGVTQVRVWLDQCLWIRDASQGSWAHTGIMPYVLWPVVSLGAKAYQRDRTTETYNRMWPFVEEVAALWSMGLFVTEEMRSANPEAGSRNWKSYNLRHRCEPEQSVLIILWNIFHGAADHLATGWKEDVKELKEMATQNVLSSSEQVVIGSDWKLRLSKVNPCPNFQAVQNLQLPIESPLLGGINIYLDGSREVTYGNGQKWHGVREWLSGNCTIHEESAYDFQIIYMSVTKVNILTDQGEFQLLGQSDLRRALWLLVAMDGYSSRFSRGRVAWTKVVHGQGSSYLALALGSGNRPLVEQVLMEQIGRDVRIHQMSVVDGAIEWT